MGAASTSELGRHRRMSFSLVLAMLAAGIAISNERGVFVPVHSVREAIDDIARAFTVVALPPGPVQLEKVRFVLPNGHTFTRLVPKAFVAQLVEPPAPPIAAPLFGNPEAAAAPANAAPTQTALNDAAPPPGPNDLPISDGAPGVSSPVPVNDTTTTNPGTPTTPANPGTPTTPTNPGTPTTPTNPTPPTDPTSPANPAPPPTNPANPPTNPPTNPVNPIAPITPSVPEPSSWVMMILGFGIIGAAKRRARRKSFQHIG